ncbi:MAG: DUF333 domain-containing protein [Paracoccus sp. (in: a-proteobacteria)]|nr:DUF333 domain-containing protein [Paracoccus sp. (in: a-proteobacteria)]
MMKSVLIAGCGLAALAGCTPEEPAVGMANPASVHCVQQGGKLEIRRESGGEVGYCHLPDGRVIEEWALYRATAG